MGTGSSNTNAPPVEIDNSIGTACENRNRFVDSPSTDTSSNYFLRTNTYNSVSGYRTAAVIHSSGAQTNNGFTVQQLLNTVTGDTTNHGLQDTTNRSLQPSSQASDYSSAPPAYDSVAFVKPGKDDALPSYEQVTAHPSAFYPAEKQT